ncbi:hypothetical protein ACFOLF_32430 [Paenibacillus sepulcri]|uniref:ABC transporter domain-containing protein n=1 Tax=Paenibacillus sepulcri TaxID=359917 RepID=A0ABS7BZU4_9BACL|nr:hypothetical protein [Paenibacillus sepulcri]
MNQVELKNISLKCKPAIMNFDSWQDQLSHFSYTFTAGKIYAVVCKPGEGGWALSYLLSGKTQAYKGEILIDGDIINRRSLQSYGWYIGEELPKKTLLGIRYRKELTIREQLESAVSSQYTVSELVDLFELAPTRMERVMRYISNERWNASTAIGHAHGKRIFCFPWLEDSIKALIGYRVQYCCEFLKQNKCISIVPVRSQSIIEDFADEIIFLNR